MEDFKPMLEPAGKYTLQVKITSAIGGEVKVMSK